MWKVEIQEEDDRRQQNLWGSKYQIDWKWYETKRGKLLGVGTYREKEDEEEEGFEQQQDSTWDLLN